jgi:hypothetical protein
MRKSCVHVPLYHFSHPLASSPHPHHPYCLFFPLSGRFLYSPPTCGYHTDVFERQSATLPRTVHPRSGYATIAVNRDTNRHRAPSRGASLPSSATRAAASVTSRQNAQRSACKARTKNAMYAVQQSLLISLRMGGNQTHGFVRIAATLGILRAHAPMRRLTVVLRRVRPRLVAG